MVNLNWARLHAQGRCQAIGVSFTDEQLEALAIKKIPVEYVRAFILDEKEYEKVKAEHEKSGDKPLKLWTLPELRIAGRTLNIKFTDAAPAEVLRELINTARSKPKKKPAVAEKPKADPKPKAEPKPKAAAKPKVASKVKAKKKDD